MILPKPQREKRTPKPLRRVRIARVSKERGQSGKVDRPRKPVRKRSAKREGVERADAEWAKAVREKYGDRCFHYFCANSATDTHHIFGKKAHPNLRYEVQNGAPMCRKHHNEAHARPRWFKENFAGWYGERWWLLLVKARG